MAFWMKKNKKSQNTKTQLNSGIEIKGNIYWLSNPSQEKKSLYMVSYCLSFPKLSILLHFERE